MHRFTLDRHLVQAAYEATSYTREVDRPDLLLIGAFVHDVGKGLPGDHSIVGAPIAAEIATRIGLPPADVATIEKLVRLHLLLPDVATRRDLSDPVTISTVAEAVGDTATLDLLHALARADSHATGPAAWSDWKGRLIAELVRRVHTALDTGVLPDPPAPDPELLDGDLPAVHLDGDRVAVAAADRRGLLAAVAACLAMHRLDVVAADASTVDGRAIVEFVTQPRYGSPYDPVALAADLRRVAAGDVSVTQRLRARAMSARGDAAAPRAWSGTGRSPPTRWCWSCARPTRRGCSTGWRPPWTTPAPRSGPPASPRWAATWWTPSTWSATGPTTADRDRVAAAVLDARLSRPVT